MIECWQAQTYQQKELVILHDRGVSVADAIPHDPRIHYYTQQTNWRIGRKRNWLCEHSRGGIIAHFDDDDWSAPERLAEQIRAMDTSGKSVVGFCSMVFEHPDGERYLYTNQNYALGTSLCYRREWWLAHRFPDVNCGEDNDFVARARAHNQLHATPAGHLMFARTHGANTSARKLNAKQWSKLT